MMRAVVSAGFNEAMRRHVGPGHRVGASVQLCLPSVLGLARQPPEIPIAADSARE